MREPSASRSHAGRALVIGAGVLAGTAAKGQRELQAVPAQDRGETAMENHLLCDWPHEDVDRMKVDATALPRVEIGDIRRGPGIVVTFEQGGFLARTRATRGASLEGPYRLGPSDEAILLSLLVLRVEGEPGQLEMTSCEAIAALLSRRGDRSGSAPPAQEAAASQTWDEANADVC